MVYIVSDLHGRFDLWKKLLKGINFSTKDRMYVLGDVIDRGSEPIGLLWDIMHRRNVRMLCGNHELHFLKRLHNGTLDDVSGYRGKNGEGVTISGFRRLSIKDQVKIVNWLETRPRYFLLTKKLNETRSTSRARFVLTHSAIGSFSHEKELHEYSADDLTEYRKMPDETFFYGKQLIFGHTPTLKSGEKASIDIGKGYIDIDCGCAFPQYGGRLACLRLDKENVDVTYLE